MAPSTLVEMQMKNGQVFLLYLDGVYVYPLLPAAAAHLPVTWSINYR